MADITMCVNKDCPKRDRCYRFLAKPSWNQSYSHFVPVNDCFISYDIEVGDDE